VLVPVNIYPIERQSVFMSATEETIFYYLKNHHVVLILAFIGGFIDATGYIKLYELFTSSITGNLVVACSAFFKNAGGVFARFFVSISFFGGAFGATAYAIKLKYFYKVSKWDLGLYMYSYEIFALLLTLIIGISVDYSSDSFPSISSAQVIFVGALLAMSMGIHNAAAQETIANCPSTTVMTMTIVKTAIYAANSMQYFLASKSIVKLYPKKEGKPDDYLVYLAKKSTVAYSKFFESIQPLIAFIVGATVGSVSVLHISFFCIFIPVTLLIVVEISIYLAKQENLKQQHQRLPATENIVESPIIPSDLRESQEEIAGGEVSIDDEEEHVVSADASSKANVTVFKL
jgi:uncharacterized membrane protein YoaK (UPF0700 family)